jgi:phage regulator Rha-like protein
LTALKTEVSELKDEVRQIKTKLEIESSKTVESFSQLKERLMKYETIFSLQKDIFQDIREHSAKIEFQIDEFKKEIYSKINFLEKSKIVQIGKDTVMIKGGNNNG